VWEIKRSRFTGHREIKKSRVTGRSTIRTSQGDQEIRDTIFEKPRSVTLELLTFLSNLVIAQNVLLELLTSLWNPGLPRNVLLELLISCEIALTSQ